MAHKRAAGTRAAGTDDSFGPTLRAAALRGHESASACPLFTDPYARMFLAAAGDHTAAPRPAAEAAAHLASRTKWFDEFLIAAGANGLEQIVLLAPGLDARAWRLPWIDGTVVYEIDRPQLLRFKTATLTAHGAEPATRYVAVPVDAGDWSAALTGAGFDPTHPTAWAVESRCAESAVRAQLEAIGELSAPGSRLAVELAAELACRIDCLTDHGWEVSSVPAATLLDRYVRCGPDQARDLAPATLFVEARAQVQSGVIAS